MESEEYEYIVKNREKKYMPICYIPQNLQDENILDKICEKQ